MQGWIYRFKGGAQSDITIQDTSMSRFSIEMSKWMIEQISETCEIQSACIAYQGI